MNSTSFRAGDLVKVRLWLYRGKDAIIDMAVAVLVDYNDKIDGIEYVEPTWAIFAEGEFYYVFANEIEAL